MNPAPTDSIMVVDWPAPANIGAVMTTRQGGVSEGAYQGFNLATHVHDRPEAVGANRQQLHAYLGLEAVPCWMNQVHGNQVVQACPGELPEADAIYTRRASQPVGVLVADCLPILLCDRDGTCVAAVHAGWRGLASGVIASTLSSLPVKSGLMAWLGPAIGACHYEVGQEVKDAFAGMDSFFAASSRPEHWMMDISAVAIRQLETLGVDEVHGGGKCTFCDPKNFYSYRRDGQGGRMAAVIWLSR